MSQQSSLAADFIGPRHAPTLRITRLSDPVDSKDATNRQWVETAIATAVATGGNPYEASNGWISGGDITYTPGSINFGVSAVVARYIDYTSEVSPVVSAVVTLGPWANQTSAYPATTVVSINIASDGTIVQNQDGTNTQILYGNLIHVGVIIHQAGVIAGNSNSKYPVADRYDLAITDLIHKFTPLNIGVNLVTASNVADLSIGVGDGYVWQHMAYASSSRTQPSTAYKPSVNRPQITMIWRDSTQTNHFETLSQQLDVTYYNPGATGSALQPIPAHDWVNIPILYAPALDLYAAQYPTGSFATKEYAVNNLGHFVHYDTNMHLFIIIGYVTVMQGATDLAAATFTEGEFFNYSAFRSGTEVYNGSEEFIANQAFVDNIYGDDTYGRTNLINQPFKTYDVAAAAVLAAPYPPLYHNEWTIAVAPGMHTDTSVSLLANTTLAGDAPRVSHWDISGGVGLHPSVASAAAGSVVGLYNVRFMSGTDVDLDFAGLTPTTGGYGVVDCRNVGFEGPFTYTARTVNDTTRFVSIGIFDGMTFNGGSHYIFTAITFNGAPLVFDASSVPLTANVSNLNTDPGTNIYLKAPNAATTCAVTLTACRLLGTITVDGSGATLYTDRGSLGTVLPTLLNGGKYVIFDEDLTEDQIESIQHAALPLSSGNPVMDTQTFNTAIGGRVPTSRTVNGHALSANVTISASDLTTGTLPHAQLPTLLQGDIPASLTSNTSGYAGSLNGLQTIPTNSVMQSPPALYDDSGKIPTTGWVYDMRGASEGLAQLTAGVVPLAQLPSSVTSGLKFKGTWNCATQTSYPLSPSVGDFYIVTVAGTMEDAQTFVVGDWFVWSGSVWQKVPSTTPDLTTWTGNAYIQSVGTITTGTWQGTMIDESRGGSGNLSGILKGNSGNAVSVASTSTDYVAPSGTSTISGIKTFSAGLFATTSLDWTTTGSAVANATYVQRVGNFPQQQVVYVSAVGDDSRDGTTITNAVKTFNRGVYIGENCGTTLSSSFQYALVCSDAHTDADVLLDDYFTIEAPASKLTGTTKLADFSKIRCRRMDSPGTNGACVQFTGGIGAGVSFVKTSRIYSGGIFCDANQGGCTVDCEIIDGLSTTSQVINVAAGSQLYIRASVLHGGVYANGSGAVVDLTKVSVITDCSFTALGGAVILYPAGGAGNVTGLLKCNGLGLVTAAVTGSDYLTTNQDITMGADLTGHGTTTINATIAASSVTLSKMAYIGPMKVIGNSTASSTTTPSALTLSAGLASNSIVWRDAHVNFVANHATEAFTNSAASLTLTVDSPQTIDMTGSVYQKITLPDATALPLGFCFKIINDVSTNIDVCKNDGSTVVLNMEAGVNCEFMLSDNGTANGSWVASPAHQLIVLTGDVTASGRSPLATTLAPITVTKLATIPAYSCIANPTGSAAVPTTLSLVSTITGDISYVGSMGSSAAATIPAGAITLAKMATIPAGCLIGNLTGGAATPATFGASMSMTGDVSWIGTVGGSSAATITSGAITLGKIANLPANSLIGNPGTSASVSTLSSLFSFTGDIQGSGQIGTNINVTVSNGAITFAKMATIPATCVLGNTLGSSGPISTISAVSTALASSVVLRDTNANSFFNLVAGGCSSIASAAGNTTLGANSTTSGTVVITGTSTHMVTLPDATTVPIGWQVRIFNRSSGIVTVNSATNSAVSTLSTGLTGIFVSTGNSNAGGVWSPSLSSAWPSTPLYTNTMTASYTAAGGSTYTLSASDIYNGPCAIAKNGGAGNATFLFPGASSVVAYISSQAGSGTIGGALTPPVGFSWRFQLYCTTAVCAASAGSGVTFYPNSPPTLGTAGHCWNGTCWITSATTYNVLFAHDP